MHSITKSENSGFSTRKWILSLEMLNALTTKSVYDPNAITLSRIEQERKVSVGFCPMHETTSGKHHITNSSLSAFSVSVP